jgi:hypothetical protein
VFIDGEDVTTIVFVPGETPDEVNANAAQMLFGPEGWEGFTPVTALECGMP